ncbi:MAG: ParA family protein [Eggerthellaceae bacterium]|nr:ParA family protein [Eggerthellaceae bacterium]
MIDEKRISIPFPLAPVNVVVGHYGVGKTNFALNVALDAAAAGAQVTLVDLDVVNPYFRSTEYRALLEDAGVRVVAPVFAERGCGLDVPSLTGAIAPAIEEAYAGGTLTIIDAGGDDAGATALGRFARHVQAGPYSMLYVVNCFRNLTQTPTEALDVLREIEAASHLSATAVVSNAHLKADTDEHVIERGATFAREVASAAGLPLACITAPKSLLRADSAKLTVLRGLDNLYPVEPHVKTPWE